MQAPNEDIYLPELDPSFGENVDVSGCIILAKMFHLPRLHFFGQKSSLNLAKLFCMGSSVSFCELVRQKRSMIPFLLLPTSRRQIWKHIFTLVVLA